MMQRIAFLAVVALAAVKAEVPVNRGDACLATEGFLSENGHPPLGYDLCANDKDHVTTSLGDGCCVSQCMATLLSPDDVRNASFLVCAGSDNAGEQVRNFEWARHYCDCSFRQYCEFACCPTCETPKVSSHNRVYGPLQSAGFMASSDNETEHDVFRFKLSHGSRNLCAVFFFAVFETGSQVVIDWTLSVLYMPYYYNLLGEPTAYVCEDILVEFEDGLELPQCGPSGMVENLQEKHCALRLPSEFASADLYGNVTARYIAYSSCNFMGVEVLEVSCDEDVGYAH